MTYRITWTGTESDLQKLVEAHIQHDGNTDTLNTPFGKIVREKLIEAHLNLGGQLKDVTIKIENNMSTWILYELSAPSLLVKTISTPPLNFTFTTDEEQAMEFQSEEEALALITSLEVDFIGTRPKGRPHK